MENWPYHIFLCPRRCVVLFYFQFQYISFSIKCKAAIKFYHSTLVPNKQYRNSDAQCNNYKQTQFLMFSFFTLALRLFIPLTFQLEKIRTMEALTFVHPQN